MSRILALDTSGSVLGIALTEDGQLAGKTDQSFGMRHTENLLPEIIALLERVAWLESPDAVCVARGPGSFTGLRIGVAAAKALGLAWDVPVISIDTMEAWAETELFYRILNRSLPPEQIVPLLDARKKRFYTARFGVEQAPRGEDKDATERSLIRLTPNEDLPLEKILENLPGTVVFPGPERIEGTPADNGALAIGHSAATGVAVAGRRLFLSGYRDGPYDGPEYLRETDIGAPRVMPRFQGS